jgi:LTXXQ motif family protein
VRQVLLAAALVTTAAIAVPITAPSAQNTESQQAQAGPAQGGPGGGQGEEHGGGPGRWMHGEGGPGMRGGPGMMMRHMMMHGNPQERCEDRLAWRAAMRAYVGAKLNLTPEQRPLWDRLQNIAQTEEQKERQLCSNPQPRGEETMLDRLDRMQAFLSTRLEGLQAAKPAVQALYQALTPEQREIFDHPFHR